MSIFSLERKRGFTLVEVLATLSIIAILSTIVYGAVGEMRKKARDTQRMSDLNQIQLALKLYNDEHGTYKVTGTGDSSTGMGWTSYTGGTYTKSLVQALYEQGYLSANSFKDPTVGDQGYMVYLCDQDAAGNYHSYSLSATKEIPIATELAYAKTVCNGDTNPPGNTNSIVSLYLKNYAVGNKTY